MPGRINIKWRMVLKKVVEDEEDRGFTDDMDSWVAGERGKADYHF